MKYDWSKERIESVIVECDSLSQVLEKLNIPRAGNNTATLRKKLEEYITLILLMKQKVEKELRIMFQ